MHNIGIVVVLYHNEAMTQKYVTEELPKLASPYTLVVVNNASTREKSEKLARECGLTFVNDYSGGQVLHDKGYLLWTSENLGYARGNNLGACFLNRIGEYDYFLFSNDDIELSQPNTLEILVSRMKEDGRIGAIGPRVVGLDGRDQSPHDTYVSPYRMIGWRLFPFLRRKNKAMVTETPQKPSSRFTYWVQGSFILVEARVFREIGMFDEHTFLYYEEPILAERLAKVGKTMYFDSDVEVVHYEGGSTKRNRKRENIEMESRIYYLREYKHINRIVLFLLKHLL